jgi:protein O-mannosyl-transferase
VAAAGLRERATAKRWRLACFACAWFVFLLPALNLPALPEEQFVQDRYLYLPSVGFAILLALAVERLGRSERRMLGMPAATALIALVLGAAMASLTVEESQIWASQMSLFTRAARKAPQSKIAQANYATALLDSNRPDEALPLLQKLAQQYPEDPVVRHNLVNALVRTGDLASAEPLLAASCRTNPAAADLYQLGLLRLYLKRPASALEPLRQAVELDPNAAGYHLVYGIAQQNLGNREAAAAEYRRELELNPANEQARKLLEQGASGSVELR